MFCPECRSEYREGIAHCTECDVDLVAELPPEEDPGLTTVLRTTNQTLLAAFRAALSAAKIPHFVRGEEAASLMPLNAVVVVPEEHVATARELLEQAEAQHD